uniref:Unkown protein n=1 Tax=Riptortus pedestris TaxID=329032 RepID=R4WE72_RIPPE|nr:unkown protein [Riptortus pedestris]
MLALSVVTHLIQVPQIDVKVNRVNRTNICKNVYVLSVLIMDLASVHNLYTSTKFELDT